MADTKRVLHVLPSTMRAGVEITVMNLYREIDREKLQFDFLAHGQGSDDLSREIESLGGRVFKVPFLTSVGIRAFEKIIYDILRTNGPYAAVHTHTEYQGGFSAKASKKAGVPIRICHAHMDSRPLHSASNLAKRIIGRFVINMYATLRCACSANAAEALFGTRTVKKGKVVIIRNGIDLSAFGDYPPQQKERILTECGSSKGTLLIGYIGRLSPEKNPGFILKMAKESMDKEDCRFVFVGSGKMLEDLKKESVEKGVSGRCVYLGTRSDVALIMQCFDIIVVPSITEGFSLVCAEAQASGTPVLAASCVPPEADMGLGLFSQLDISEGSAIWLRRAREIISSAKRPDKGTRLDALRKKGHDAKDNVKLYMKLYGIE